MPSNCFRVVLGSIDKGRNTVNKTSAVNREYVNDKLKKKLDKQKDINMGGNKIVSYRKPNDFNELVNKSYVDQKVSQAGGSVDLAPYLKKDGSVVMTNDLNLNNNKLINLKDAIDNQDATTLKQFNGGISTISTDNRQYTDKRIGESHISSHDYRTNVFKYVTETLTELIDDFGMEVDS